jgi:hypothetical protein
MLNCQGSAECHGDCQAQASANVNCPPPQVVVAISGDDALYATYEAHLSDIGIAVNLTTAIEKPTGDLAGRTAQSFSVLGDIGVAGASCVAAQAQLITSVQASVSVSVTASAEVTTGKS